MKCDSRGWLRTRTCDKAGCPPGEDDTRCCWLLGIAGVIGSHKACTESERHGMTSHGLVYATKRFISSTDVYVKKYPANRPAVFVVGSVCRREAPINGGMETRIDRYNRMLLCLDAIYENTRNVNSWMTAAGQVEMRVVWIAVNPKPFTIWLENYPDVSIHQSNAARATLTWLAKVDGIVLPLKGMINRQFPYQFKL